MNTPRCGVQDIVGPKDNARRKKRFAQQDDVITLFIIITQMLQVSFVVKAVSALTAAFRLVQLDSCGQVSDWFDWGQ